MSHVWPSLRINKDLQSESGLLKRKAPLDASNNALGNGPPVRKVRPSTAENEADIQILEKEIRALHWLARRKEQEWDQVGSEYFCTLQGLQFRSSFDRIIQQIGNSNSGSFPGVSKFVETST